MLVFGLEFIERVESKLSRLKNIRKFYYVGNHTPMFADSYYQMITYCSSRKPPVELTDDDEAAIYFSSGTTGFPKAILHKHRSLTQIYQDAYDDYKKG